MRRNSFHNWQIVNINILLWSNMSSPLVSKLLLTVSVYGIYSLSWFKWYDVVDWCFRMLWRIRTSPSHHCLARRCICVSGLHMCAHVWREGRREGGSTNLIDWPSAALEMAVWWISISGISTDVWWKWFVMPGFPSLPSFSAQPIATRRL